MKITSKNNMNYISYLKHKKSFIICFISLTFFLVSNYNVIKSNINKISPFKTSQVQAQGVNTKIARLEDLWNNQAIFQFVRKLDQPASEWMNLNNTFVVRNGVWYWFNRNYLGIAPNTKLDPSVPDYCLGNPYAGYSYLTVRVSYDKGATWTPKTQITPTTPNTAYECNSVDGGAFFDEENTTWHYVYQCQNRDTTNPLSWRVCHASLKGENPAQMWIPDPLNPVLEGGKFVEKISQF